jgi:chemotaxis protein MotB
MAGKGGGAWKVAYADFVTAMMAFFLVMWIVAQNKPVKQAIAQYFNDPMGTSSRPGKAKAGLPIEGGGPIPKLNGTTRVSAPRSTESAPKTEEAVRARNASKPTLPALQDSNHSTVGMLIPFAEDSAELDARGKQILDKLAPDLDGKLSKIEIRGHASGRPLPAGSGFQDAWQLSYARSMATMKYLTEKGIQPRRLRLSQSGPFDPNTFRADSAISAQNARVEIYELNELISDSSASREAGGKTPKKPEFKRPAGSRVPTSGPANDPAAGTAARSAE